MSITFTDQDKATLRIAAYGAVALLTAAGVAGGKPHRISTDGSIALASATGAVGHVLGEKPGAVKLNDKTVAALADQVLPALTESMSLLKRQDPAEADNFRSIVLLALEAATHRGEPSPTMTDMIRKITNALDAA
ncbi:MULTISPECIES: hypothetical protein [Kitasatospora]|uniref:hypothetical protein n=1 Tax=Kitasatospora TaxID=2063 RepID=UPI000C7148F3|nr:hypothetical protein [Kitasatospora sp. GP30]MDH6141297.1 hypothetical protein [Kitasatospora sp. GP30]